MTDKTTHKTRRAHTFNPSQNPFFRKRNDKDVTLPGMLIMPDGQDKPEAEAYLEASVIKANIEAMMTDDMIGACRQIKYDRLKLAPVHIQIGEEIKLTCTAAGGSSLMEVDWQCEGKKAEEYKDLVDEIADILQASKDAFLEDALDSIHVAGVVVVQPRVEHPIFGRRVPGVRKWCNTKVGVRVEATEYKYRVWDTGLPITADTVLPDAVVFDCFGNRPIIANGLAIPSAPVGRVRRRADFMKTIYGAAMTTEINNSAPPMVLQPIPQKAAELTAAAINPSLVATGNAIITQQALQAQQDELNQQRVNEHNHKQVLVQPLERLVKIQTSKGYTYESIVQTSQYILPSGFQEGPAVPESRSRNDLTQLDETYQNIVCSNMGVPRSLVFGDIDQKTNSGLLQRMVAESLQSFATEISKIYTFAINALLVDFKANRRLIKEGTPTSDPEKIKKAAKEDWVHVSFALEAYDASTLLQLYGAKAIDYATMARRLCTLAGVKDSVKDGCKDPWDDEVKEVLFIGGSGVKRPADKQAEKSGKTATKKAKTGEGGREGKQKTEREATGQKSEKKAMHGDDRKE